MKTNLANPRLKNKYLGVSISFFENNGLGRLYWVKSGLPELEHFKNLKIPCKSQVNKKIPGVFKVFVFGNSGFGRLY